MKKAKIVISAIFFLSISTGLYSQTAYNFNDGLKAAKSSGKKVFLTIYSDSDNWSKKMDSEVFSTQGVKDGLGDFVYVRLDVNGSSKYNYGGKEYSSSELAKLLGATGYPTFAVLNADGSIIFFKYQGESVSNLSGFIGAEDFVELLAYFSQGKFKDTDLSSVFQN